MTVVPGSSTTPAVTLGDYKTRVQNKGYDQTSTVLTGAINAARRHVFGARRWQFLQARYSGLALTTGNPYLTITSVPNLGHVEAVRLSDSTYDYDLNYLEPQVLRSRLVGVDTTDVPEFWTRHDDSLIFLEPPDAAYTVTIDYVTDHAADLAADADPCVIPPLYADVVVWKAVADLAFRQRDWNAAQQANVYFEESLARMVRQYGLQQRQTSRQVTSGYWDDVGT